jgi:hypothetical protein
MPANGIAVALPLAPELPSTPAKATASKPDGGIETTIGEATAAAAVAIGQALVDFEAGGRLTPATRMLGGERIGLHLGEFDFATTVRREGKRVLHQRHGAAFRQHYGVDLPEAALDEIIGWLLAIVQKVVADERALAH